MGQLFALKIASFSGRFLYLIETRSVAKKEKNSKEPVPKKVSAPAVHKKIWQRPYFFDLIVFIFAFLLFANSIPNDYNLDDELVTVNHRLTSKGISAIGEIFTSPYYQDESGYSYEYRPVVLVSFAIEHQFFGDNPHISHFINVLLYALLCLLLFRVLKILFYKYSIYLSLAIALLFAAHPIHTEVVCSIKNRDEILGFIFSLCALYAAVASARSKNKWLLLLVPLCFTLSLLSKLTFLSFAVLIPLAALAFADIDLLSYFFVLLSVIVPMGFLIDTGLWSQRMALLLIYFALSMAVYSVSHYAQTIAFVQELPKRARTFFDSPASEVAADSGEDTYVKAFIAALTSVSLISASVHLCIIVLYVLGVYYQLLSLQIAACIILITLLLTQKNRSWRWLSLITAFTLMITGYYFSGLLYGWIFIYLLFIPIVYYSIWPGKELLIPGVIAVIAIILIGIVGDYDQNYPFVAPVLFGIFYAQRYRWGWLAIAAGLIFKVHLTLSMSSDLYHLNPRSFTVNKIDFLLFAAVALSLYFKKYTDHIVKAYVIAALLVGTVLFPRQYQDRQVIINAPRTTIGAINAQQIKALSSNRPIQYVENCVNEHTPKTVKAGTSLEILLKYLSKTICPYPLSFYYGYSFITPMQVSDPMPLLSLFIHLLLLGLAVWLWQRARLISCGILVYIIAIAPFTNYFVLVPGMLADRFLLVPSLGWCIAIASLAFILSGRLSSRQLSWTGLPAPLRYGMLALLTCYTVLSISRNFDWKNDLVLFEHDLTHVDNSAQAHNLFAVHLMKASFAPGITPGEQLETRQKALGHFKKAVLIYPSFFNATYDIGRTYLTMGQVDSAIIYFHKTLDIDPASELVEITMVNLLTQQHKEADAIASLTEFIRHAPSNYTAHDKLSYLLFLQKDYPGAIRVLKQTIVIAPENPVTYIGLAKVYHIINKDDSTRYWLNEALRVKPDYSDAKALLQSLNKP